MGYSIEELAGRLLKGDRLATARLISLAENNPGLAQRIVSFIYPYTGRAHIVGVTGPPGSGKSTLVYRLARELRRRSKTVGIIAVDPSSPFSGGALLGDRIRMQSLTGDEGVFIRSMATRGSLGGLARATRDAVRILDASGKDIVIVETVGAGQSEVDIMGIAHTILVVFCPGLGDEIQALKAGIIEIGDIFVVNKSDREGADETVMQLEDMLNMSPTFRAGMYGWIPPVVKTSAAMNRGIKELLDWVEEHWRFLKRLDMKIYLKERVRQEIIEALQSKIEHMARNILDSKEYERLVGDVAERRVDPYTAADIILSKLIRNISRRSEEDE